MSLLLGILDLNGSKKKPLNSGVSLEALRDKYGFPQDLDVKKILGDLIELDKKYPDGVSSQKGVDFALLSRDINVGEIEPQHYVLDDGRVIARPTLFRIGGSGLSGFKYAVDNFLPNLPYLRVDPFDIDAVTNADGPTEVISFHNNGVSNSTVIIPESMINRVTQTITAEGCIAVAYCFDGSYEIAPRITYDTEVVLA